MTWGIGTGPDVDADVQLMYIEKFACFAKLELLNNLIDEIVILRRHFRGSGDVEGVLSIIDKRVTHLLYHELEMLPLFGTMSMSMELEIRDYEEKQKVSV